MISMECLLTLIHGPRPADKWLNSSAVKARGFLWACDSLCTFSWREGSSQLTDTELTMKHTKRSPSSTSAAHRKAEGLYDRDWSGYTTPTQTAHMNAVLIETNIYVINLYFKDADFTARLEPPTVVLFSRVPPTTIRRGIQRCCGILRVPSRSKNSSCKNRIAFFVKLTKTLLGHWQIKD